MSIRIEWMEAEGFSATLYGSDDEWAGTGLLDPGEYALAFSSGGEVTAVHGSREEIARAVERLAQEVSS